MGNKLENWIKARNGDEKIAMDILQNHGIVSDNCVMPCDVGNDKEAMKWLAKNIERLSKARV